MAAANDRIREGEDMSRDVDLPTSAMEEQALTSPDDLRRSVPDEANPSFLSIDQESAENLLSSLPADFFLPSTGFNDTTASVTGCEPLSMPQSGCQSSQKSSAASSWPQCPFDPETCSAVGLSCGSNGAAQQDIELCLPSPSEIHLSPTEPFPYAEPPFSPNELTGPSEPQPDPTRSSSNEGRRPSHPKLKSRSAAAPTTAVDPNDGDRRPLSGRTNHSLIEQKYRKNLNARLDQLQQLLSAVESGTNAEDEQHAGAIGKIKKSDVLLGAIKYVKQSEWQKRELSRTNEFLRQRVVALEKLVKCEDCALLKQMNWLNLQSSTSVPFTVSECAS